MSDHELYSAEDLERAGFDNISRQDKQVILNALFVAERAKRKDAEDYEVDIRAAERERDFALRDADRFKQLQARLGNVS